MLLGRKTKSVSFSVTESEHVIEQRDIRQRLLTLEEKMADIEQELVEVRTKIEDDCD